MNPIDFYLQTLPKEPQLHRCDICQKSVDRPHWELVPWKLGSHLEKMRINCLRCDQTVYIPLRRKRSKKR